MEIEIQTSPSFFQSDESAAMNSFTHTLLSACLTTVCIRGYNALSGLLSYWMPQIEAKCTVQYQDNLVFAYTGVAEVSNSQTELLMLG